LEKLKSDPVFFLNKIMLHLTMPNLDELDMVRVIIDIENTK